MLRFRSALCRMQDAGKAGWVVPAGKVLEWHQTGARDGTSDPSTRGPCSILPWIAVFCLNQ